LRLRTVAVPLAVAVAVVGLAVSSGTRSAAPRHGNLAAAARGVTVRPGIQRMARASSSLLTTAKCEKRYGFACYGPTQLERAYALKSLYAEGITGKGRTIVIVDSFGSPTIRHDLAVFDKAYHLPAPPSLRTIQPAGKVAPYRPTATRAGWAGETTLDVEYAHAMAPGARILVVETPVSEEEGTSGFPQIVRAEKYVVNHHLGAVISQSFSATEQTFPSGKALRALRGAYVDAAKHRVTVLAASGDSGAADVHTNEIDYYLHPVTSWPDSDPLVTGVGGTQLHLTATGAHASPDTVWNDTFDPAVMTYFTGTTTPSPFAGGGGKSIFFARPAFQNGVASVVGDHRGVPDIAMSGACNGGVLMYSSYPGDPAGWAPTCGTSEATPLFAGIVALAAQYGHHLLGRINPALYRMSAARDSGIVDVTSGSTTVRFHQNGKIYTVTGAKAAPGYDLASGVGTVDGALFVPQLAAATR